MPQTIAPPSDLLRRLDKAGQSHIMKFFDQLDEKARKSLLEQAQGIDWESTPAWVEKYVKSKPMTNLAAEDLEPAPY